MSEDIRQFCGETSKNDVAQINKHAGFDEIQMSIGGRSNESSVLVRQMTGFSHLALHV